MIKEIWEEIKSLFLKDPPFERPVEFRLVPNADGKYDIERYDKWNGYLFVGLASDENDAKTKISRLQREIIYIGDNENADC